MKEEKKVFLFGCVFACFLRLPLRLVDKTERGQVNPTLVLSLYVVSGEYSRLLFWSVFKLTYPIISKRKRRSKCFQNLIKSRQEPIQEYFRQNSVRRQSESIPDLQGLINFSHSSPIKLFSTSSTFVSSGLMGYVENKTIWRRPVFYEI